MQFRRLGRTNLRLSVLTLGLWRLFESPTKVPLGMVASAIDMGVNSFDSAENYGEGEANRLFGTIIKSLKVPRSHFIVSAKVGFGRLGPNRSPPTAWGLSAKHLRDGCDETLQDLGVDYLDLFACHLHDDQASISEIVWAMHRLVMEGKVLYWGTSKWPAASLKTALDFATCNHLTPPSFEQPEYNLLRPQVVHDELDAICLERHLGLMSWAPLKQGILSGKYHQGGTCAGRFSGKHEAKSPLDAGSDIQPLIEHMKQIAFRMDATISQVALAWCLKHRAVTSLIIGATNAEQMRENVDALQFIERLSEDDWLGLLESAEACNGK